MHTNRSVLLCGLVAACSGAGGGEIDASLTNDAEPAVDAPSGDAPPAVDATVEDGSPSDGAPSSDAAPTATYAGWVVLAETSEPTNGAGSLTAAGFTSGSACGLASCGPALGIAGECALYDLGPSVGLSAGTVTVTGGAATVTLVPSGIAPAVTYAPLLAPPIDAFSPGATLTFSAGGGAEIPAFTGAVTAPEKLVGWVPPTTISRSAGVSAAWTAGTGGAIWVEVQAFDPGMSTERILLCHTNDDGAYTVPSSALALIPAPLTLGFVFVSRANVTIVPAGDALIYLELVDAAVSGLVTIGP